MLFPRLLALFLIVPVVELVLFMVLGRYFGIPGTLALIIITALLGANLTRSQGLRTLARFQQRVASGQIPGEEIIAGMLILIAGALLLTPGFLTDAIGFSLLFSPVRNLLGHWLLTHYSSKAEWKTSQATHREQFSTMSDSSSSGEEKIIDVEATERSVPGED